MKRLLSFAALGAVAVWISGYNPALADSKTTVCHLEDKSSNAGHVISVAASSVDSHVAHGDEYPTNLPAGSACLVDGDPDT